MVICTPVISKPRRWALAAAAVLLLAAGACAPVQHGLVPTGTNEPDKFLFDKGTAALTDKKWLVAREYFKTLVESYTQSTYRPDAKLALGDTYLGENSAESLVLAINEFKEFLTFFPTNRRADYAQLKLATAYYQQMRAAQRDQTETKDAIRELQVFVERYPNSSLMPEAKTKLRAAQDRLDESDYLVGLFYYRIRWYPGAIDRFQSVLKQDPEYTGRDAVFFYLGESLIKLQRPAEALPYFERLTSEFEQSEFLEEAQKRIVTLKNEALTKNDKNGAKP